MSVKGQAAKAALDALSGVADDVVRAVASPKKAKLQALDELAKPVTQALDDWGWKGGKPGEITGGAWGKIQSAVGGTKDDYKKLAAAVDKQLRKSKNPEVVSLYQHAVNSNKKWANLAGSAGADFRAKAAAQKPIMETFEGLEYAGFPRDLTARAMTSMVRKTPTKISTARSGGLFVPDYSIYKRLSKALEEMSAGTRETVISLLPDWTGSLDELIVAAKELG
jgi:hypothetical protein